MEQRKEAGAMEGAVSLEGAGIVVGAGAVEGAGAVVGAGAVDQGLVLELELENALNIEQEQGAREALIWILWPNS